MNPLTPSYDAGMTMYTEADDFRGAVFREVDLTGARMHGVLLTGADIDGDIRGLIVNGVEVAPLIAAELDRRHPERATLRSTTPDGLREALAVVEGFWAATVDRARAGGEVELNQSVNDEWSFIQTLRHLVFVTDSWFAHAVLGRSSPFHPMALPASFDTNGATYGIDSGVRPSLDEVLVVRAERFDQVRAFLAGATQADLEQLREPTPAPGWPPPAPRTAIECLHVVFNEEWAHHQFAVRDLTIIEAARTS
jgi:hypothetical protein